MLLYHWTWRDRAEAIRRDGINETAYDWPVAGARGVWMSADPVEWKDGGDACVVFDVPDELLDPSWLHPTRGWCI